MIAVRRRLSLVLLAGLVLASVIASIGGGAGAQVTIGDLTPIDRPGPDIPINTPTLVPIFPTEEPEPTVPPVDPNPNDPNNPNPNIPQPDAPTPTLVPIFPVETVEPDIPVRVTPPVIPILTPVDSLALTPATITIRTRICDNEGFDPYYANLFSNTEKAKTAYEAECPLSTAPFGFSMYYPGKALSKVTAGGVVTFSVPAMTTVVVEDANPEGYDDSMYICSSGAWEENGLDFADLPHEWATSPGEKIECTWYFVRKGDDINLVIGKRTCPSFDPTTLTEATQYCEGRTGGYFGTVTLSDLDPSTPDLVRAAGSEEIAFLDIPPGTYTITESGIAAGTEWTYWGSCTAWDQATGYPSSKGAVVTSSTLTIALAPGGDTYTCISFNVLPEGVEPEPLPAGDLAIP